MVNKLIVLGIDGMDFDVVRKYEDLLPNLSEMMSQNGYPHLRSVFPADTTPAWSTIYLGVDPSVHGIINFVNIGDRDNQYKPISFDDSAFCGKTFWDKLNEQGFSCAVLLPMNIKVGWDIGGLMITRPCEGKMNVYPASKEEIYKPNYSILGTESKFTSAKKLKALRDEFFAKAAEEFRLTKAVCESENVDVLFSYFSTTDGIQHDFWRHGDENHPEYPGNTEFQYAIRDMYVKMDEYIGEIQKLCPNTKMLVISDHGHGARPVYVARVNEMLRRAGFLTPKTKAVSSAKKKFSFKNCFKKTVLSFVHKFGLPKWLVRILKKVPFWKGLFASGADFDWDNTVAYLSDLSAMKNYSYGGIRIRSDIEDKDALCDKVIESLKDIMIEEDGVKAFKWIRRTNTLYRGEQLDRYPEIIFQLDERYGADWNLGNKLFEKKGGFMHTLSPGSHRYETAVIAARGIKLDKKIYELTDIYRIITEIVERVV